MLEKQLFARVLNILQTDNLRLYNRKIYFLHIPKGSLATFKKQ